MADEKVRYFFREGEILGFKNAKKADPQKIGEALAIVAAKNRGRLPPRSIVNDARSRTNWLHQHFEWRDAIAAEKHRLDQARALVRCIHIESPSTESGTVRAYLSIHDRSGTAYRAIQEVLTNHDLQRRVLQEAERDLDSFVARFQELEDVCSLVRQARDRLAERRRGMGKDGGTRATI